MSENTLLQNEAASVESAPVRGEWSAPQVEELSVAEKTALGSSFGTDGSGSFTGS